MKGFTKDGKFHPIKPYNKVRKSRDNTTKEQGVRMKRLTQLEVDEIKKNVLPLDKTALRIMKHGQDDARRDRFANPRWNSMTQAERLNALNRAVVNESAMFQKLQSREELSKLSYHELPHYAKTDLAFNFFNLDRKGGQRKKRFLSEDDIDRLSELQLNATFKEVETRWEERRGETNLEGDGFYMIFRNKKSPEHTFEIHPLTDTVEAEPPEYPEDQEFDAWYWFPAKNGKGLWNSPTTLSATGGYTKKDAIREFKKEFISYDQEFSS